MPSNGNAIEQFAYVYTGFVFWMALNKAIMMATTFLPGKLNHYFQNNIRFFEAYFITGLKTLYILVLNLPFIFAIIVYSGDFHIIWFLQVFLLLLLLMVFFISIGWVVSVLCAIYKGLGGLVALGMRFLFFASPIFWSVDSLSNSSKQLLFFYNPISYLISSFRQIIMMQNILLSDLIISIGLVTFSALFSSALYLLVGKKVKNVS